MPNRRGPNTSHGYLSPKTEGWPKPIREEVKHVYGAYRVKHPGESHATKGRGARIAWAAARRKYPKLYRDYISRQKQIERGTKIEHKEHPEFALSTARRIATDHVNKGKDEYLPHHRESNHRRIPTRITTPNLHVPHIKPAKILAGKRVQIKDLHAAAKEQRVWANEAETESQTESSRAKKFRKEGVPVRAKVLSDDARVARGWSKNRRALANDLDSEAARIQAQVRAEQIGV